MNFIEEFKSMGIEEQKEAYHLLVNKLHHAVHGMEEAYTKRELEAKGHPITHIFGDGFYLRDMTIPADQLIVTEMHSTENPLFLMEGECAIFTESGVEEVKAPWYTITKPGTQRVILTNKHCNFITVHPVDVSTVEEAEEACIYKQEDDPRYKLIKE